MGLLRGMARTAAVAGTATAVSNRVSRRQAERWQRQDDAQQAQRYEPQPAYADPAPPAGGAGAAVTAEIQRLADLKQQGILTEEEFAAAKARLLGL